MRLLVLCPSYKRPIAAAAVLDSFRKNTTLDARLIFLMYEKDNDSVLYTGDVVLCPEELMVPRVNGALGLLDDFSHVGWIADDNRFETKGWDGAVGLSVAGHRAR